MANSEQPHSGVVLITGASSGIGADAAFYLNELGYTVAANVRKEEEGRDLKAKAKFPDAYFPIKFDVTSDDEVAAALIQVQALLKPGEGLRALFSNAGIANFGGDVSCEGLPISKQEQILQVNFLGAMRVIQTFLPLIRQAKGTVVINTALMTHTVLPFNGGYAPSKSALETYADALRREVRRYGVRVVSIRAAAISTGLLKEGSTESIPTDNPYPEQRKFIEQALADQAKQASNPACDPRRFSELVAKSIAAPKPKLKPIVGGRAKLLWLIGSLPQGLQDKLMAKMIRRAAAK